MLKMPPVEDIKWLQDQLRKWFKKHGRIFPWRNISASSYQVIISEILLQRTRAETVAGFFHFFVKRYPSWRKLSEATENDLKAYLKPIGLWRRRSASLKRLSCAMVERHGRFPRKREEIEKLPGIGQYIANAVLLFCYREPHPLLDVNMSRVLERFFRPRKLADIRYDPYLQELSLRVVSEKDSRILNWSILDLSGLICQERTPKCNECPLIARCNYKKRQVS